MRVDWGGILLISIRMPPRAIENPQSLRLSPTPFPVGFCRIELQLAPGIVSSRLCWLNFNNAGPERRFSFVDCQTDPFTAGQGRLHDQLLSQQVSTEHSEDLMSW